MHLSYVYHPLEGIMTVADAHFDHMTCVLVHSVHIALYMAPTNLSATRRCEYVDDCPTPARPPESIVVFLLILVALRFASSRSSFDV